MCSSSRPPTNDCVSIIQIRVCDVARTHHSNLESSERAIQSFTVHSYVPVHQFTLIFSLFVYPFVLDYFPFAPYHSDSSTFGWTIRLFRCTYTSSCRRICLLFCVYICCVSCTAVLITTLDRALVASGMFSNCLDKVNCKLISSNRSFQ